ncbi:GNAT family N-acetyltransferase [Nonomuraea sp. K274]|uniref:GNAT family N-acetyltransferase n=1 Tax=Nonomuraea cypriaca TaxID=1187855 RepID=A0A931A924_9ACTN|nr:GNAT family N-acetyltransferase [Nonomuraea cypriaca]MBF8188506.1 GNAT family N-acetyltransferase [Nonomuraea cypriaca]
MRIRRRAPEDLDACVEALATVHAADRYPANWPDDPGAWPTPDDPAMAWIAAEASLTTEITRLFVSPVARGRGLAGRLLDAVRAAVRTPLKLEVLPNG